MSRFKPIAFVVLLVAGGGAWLLWQHQTVRRLETENMRLRERVAELDSVRAENSRLAQAQTDPAELERLRNAQSELLRLRGEVAQLRRQTKAAQPTADKRAVPAQTPAPASPAEPPALPVQTYAANVRASVAPRQTLITGGWSTQAGKRTLLLIEPDLIGAADQPGQVMLRTQFVEVPDHLLDQVGLAGLRAENNQSTAQTILTAEQAAALQETMQQTAGVNVLSAPRVSTGDGRQAQVKVVDIKTISGVTHEVGPSVDITPRIAADGASVDLTIAAHLRVQTTPAP